MCVCVCVSVCVSWPLISWHAVTCTLVLLHHEQRFWRQRMDHSAAACYVDSLVRYISSAHIIYRYFRLVFFFFKFKNNHVPLCCSFFIFLIYRSIHLQWGAIWRDCRAGRSSLWQVQGRDRQSTEPERAMWNEELHLQWHMEWRRRSRPRQHLCCIQLLLRGLRGVAIYTTSFLIYLLTSACI